ncbi:hypothetical protein T07_1792 [Trichinella nelsoni]|uniref:Uncharacterized protein n=1 Tax=Trichinella nelsoni TaxID=6336 RepID=A0A0V0SE91_9BILA|nr:hypothetical protein T07_1792 [Trichinella nelsoni]
MLSATAVVAMLEIAVQQRELVVFYHHMKGQKPSFLEITTLSNFILQQKNSFYNALCLCSFFTGPLYQISYTTLTLDKSENCELHNDTAQSICLA